MVIDRFVPSCWTTPGAMMVELSSVDPASTRAGSTTAPISSTESTPFWIGTMQVSGPTTGPIASAASAVSYVLTANRIRSNVPPASTG